MEQLIVFEVVQGAKRLRGHKMIGYNPKLGWPLYIRYLVEENLTWSSEASANKIRSGSSPTHTFRFLYIVSKKGPRRFCEPPPERLHLRPKLNTRYHSARRGLRIHHLNISRSMAPQCGGSLLPSNAFTLDYHLDEMLAR